MNARNAMIPGDHCPLLPAERTWRKSKKTANFLWAMMCRPALTLYRTYNPSV